VPDEPSAAEFRVEDHPDPADLEVLETQIRREASAAMGLDGEADLAIFVRDAGTVVAGMRDRDAQPGRDDEAGEHEENTPDQYRRVLMDRDHLAFMGQQVPVNRRWHCIGVRNQPHPGTGSTVR
jgi:hypothetical protein